MTQSAISLRALTKYFGETRGIEDLTLDVEPGEVVGFPGPNGAGKTTTMRTVMGLISATSGEAYVLGQNALARDPSVDLAYLPSGTTGFRELASFRANEIDRCSDVYDQFNIAPRALLGSVCVGDPNPTVFNYDRVLAVPSTGTVVYPNTATVVARDTGTTHSASAQVRVSGSAVLGSKTIGFWQNKNGQSIITSQATTGVCPSGTWLRQYNPFQDLSATATCKQVATYVFNVVKVADASGASMNAMLKAQMLATALDVYFSDATLGGNKLAAPAPIGGVTIDLTNVWGSEDVRNAFGGSTSMTVAQMLTYASMQASGGASGGATWYGQVKSIQQLAKDAFDAINNDKVFGA